MSEERCVLCLEPLGGNESPEHVILNAFGGRRTTRRAICTGCNHRTNELADRHFAADYAFWRNYLWLNAGDGDDPPTLRKLVSADGQRYDLAPGARPVARGLQFEPDATNPGSAHVGGAPERLIPALPDLAKGLGVSPDSIAEGIHAGFAEKVVPLRTMRQECTLCSQTHLRSVAKSALILWSLAHGNAEACRDSFGAARRFALGGPAEPPFEGASDLRVFPLEPPAHLARREFDNWLAVWLGDDAMVYAHMRLLGHIGYSLRLGRCESPLGATMLWTDPIEGNWWEGQVEPPSSWTFPEDINVEVVRQQLARFTARAKLRHSRLAIESAVGRTMAVHLQPGAEEVTPEQMASIVTELDQTMALMFSADGDAPSLELPRSREQTLRQLGLPGER